MEIILQGIILGLSIAAPIGPNNIEMIKRGLKEGWKTSLIFGLGAIVALIIYLLLVIFGFSFLIKSDIFNTTLLIFGIIVLFYLTYESIKNFLLKKKLKISKKINNKKHFFSGIIISISNPAVLLLWTGILGADFVINNGSIERCLILSSGILVGVFIFFTILITLIHKGRKFINNKIFGYISLISGLIFLFFAIKFSYKLIIKFI